MELVGFVFAEKLVVYLKFTNYFNVAILSFSEEPLASAFEMRA